jgi:hypothetical protein
MNRCKDCRYFGREVIIERWRGVADHRIEVIKTGYHACGGVEHFGGPYSDIRGQGLAVIADSDGRFAELRVLPAFGCAMFASKNGEGE